MIALLKKELLLTYFGMKKGSELAKEKNPYGIIFDLFSFQSRASNFGWKLQQCKNKLIKFLRLEFVSHLLDFEKS